MSDPVLEQSKAFAWTLAQTLKRAAERMGIEQRRLTVVPVWMADTERFLWVARLKVSATIGVVPASPYEEDPVSAIRALVKQQTKGMKTQLSLPDLDFDGCRCGRVENLDGSKVRWKCGQCDHMVCRECALTIPGSSPTEYYFETLCSKGCWEKAGRPAE